MWRFIICRELQRFRANMMPPSSIKHGGSRLVLNVDLYSSSYTESKSLDTECNKNFRTHSTKALDFKEILSEVDNFLTAHMNCYMKTQRASTSFCILLRFPSIWGRRGVKIPLFSVTTPYICTSSTDKLWVSHNFIHCTPLAVSSCCVSSLTACFW
jgi:hypothetical protein